MNIITNIYTYTFNVLLLLQDKSLIKDFNDNIILKLDVLKSDSEKKKYITKIQKNIITVLNKFINKNEFNRKELSYLKDLRNYFMQVKTLLEHSTNENPFEYLSSINNEEFKKQLTTISNNSGIIKGKMKSVRTGEIIETERRRKNDKLNFFDKNYSFSYTIKKN